MTQKRGREEGRAEPLVSSSSPKRPKASPFLEETSPISDNIVSKIDEGISDDDDDDYTSSSGTSSSEDDEDEEEEEETQRKHDSARKEETTQDQKMQYHSPNFDNETITYVPGRPKPRIQSIQPDDQSGLMSRISSFLPQLQAANADLEKKTASGSTLHDMILDDVKEGEEGQYIEMVSTTILKPKRRVHFLNYSPFL